jgi:hypothetical protein
VKQLTVFCSRDLEPQVVSALDDAGLHGYLRVGDATGNRFLAKGQMPRTATWEAVMIVVPGAEDTLIDGVRKKLQGVAASCEVEPCIRLLVNTACETY